MLYVEGVGFTSKADYEAALSDKKIIDELRRRYDLNTKTGLMEVSKELTGIHFKTKVGDNFDDEIFERLEAAKRGNGVAQPAQPQASRQPASQQP